MSLATDLKVLYHMVLSPIRGTTHQERLESFYGKQADAYDDFRAHLLQGRKEMYQALPIEPNAVMLDMGGGTGYNIEHLGERVGTLSKIYIVDLSQSLLDVARKRIREHGWTNVQTVQGDVTNFVPDEGNVDLVTFSYSLTMIPEWFAAIDHAYRLLRPGGHIGVVDFYVSRKYPRPGHRRHGWFVRSFWPVWLALDNVFPITDHVPYLHHRFEPVLFAEHMTRMRYLPFVPVPYYRFIGRKPSETTPTGNNRASATDSRSIDPRDTIR